MAKRIAGSSVTRFADKYGRHYITPEDVLEALKVASKETVRKDVLAVIGRQTAYGAEDASLCAFNAWAGKR